MAIEPTNMARLCTAKWQPLWVKLDAHKYCQIFVSPYTWDYLYFYNNEWHEVGDNDMYYYDRTKWVKVTDEWLKLQYSNKVRDFSVTPATMYTVTLTTNWYWWSLTLNWTPVEWNAEISVAEWTSITVNDTTLSIWDYTVVAVPEEWYHFVDWTEEHRWSIPATVTWNLTVEAEFMDSMPATFRWANVQWEDESQLTAWLSFDDADSVWMHLPLPFDTNLDLLNVGYEISNTAEWVDDSNFSISFSENEDTESEYPFICNVEYSGDLSDIEPEQFVAEITIKSLEVDETDIGTLTLIIEPWA